MLRKIEQLKLLRATPDQTRVKLDQLLARENLLGGSSSNTSDTAVDTNNYYERTNDSINVDEVSHFILRLSYCQSEDLRKWFLQQESELFRHRLKSLTPEQWSTVAAAMPNINNTPSETSGSQQQQLKPISKAAKDRMAHELMSILSNPSKFAETKFFAVPFEMALEMVAKRECYVHNGEAVLPQEKLLSILVHKFRAQLSHSLALMAASNNNNTSDPEADRIQPLLRNMSRILVHAEPELGDTAIVGQTITAANVMNYRDNMPLCMRQLQTGMQQDKKLKHWGRLQYGLFLKGAGLSMEDALAFFQRHFSIVTGEQFQKQYSYNIRHMYGKEGKRVTYTPYNCAKIILGNAPSAGDHHGCPYKHYDAEHLNQLLQKLSIGTSADRHAIVALKKSNDFQLACQKHFEIMHPGAASIVDVPLDNVGNHPNSWFRASVAYKEGHRIDDNSNTEPPYQSSSSSSTMIGGVGGSSMHSGVADVSP